MEGINKGIEWVLEHQAELQIAGLLVAPALLWGLVKLIEFHGKPGSNVGAASKKWPSKVKRD